MSRRGENIYKRKDGRWEGRYIKKYENSKACYGYVYAKSYKEVKEKLSMAKKNSQNNSSHISILLENNPIFETVASQWMAYKSLTLKNSSIAKYNNLLNLYILPYLGKKYINQITTELISKYINQLLLSGGKQSRGLSSKTAKDILSIIKSVHMYAKQTYDLPVIFFNNISVKTEIKPLRVLSKHEQSLITRYIKNNPTSSNLGILICLFTGIRLGELCVLKWDDIIFNEHCIYINKTMQRIQNMTDNSQTKTSVVISSPKSNCSIRKIPLPDNLYNILQQFKCNNDCYLLTGSTSYIEPRTMQNRFKKLISVCGIEAANFHSLRHTFATRCIELGFDPKSLSEILGHASVNITLNRYVHPSLELKQQNMNLLTDLFSVN